MTRVTAVLFTAALAVATLLLPAADAPQRPRILGDAHVAFYVSDLAKARAFYKDFLGYAEPYTLNLRHSQSPWPSRLESHAPPAWWLA
jgi:lactoylglutathione lyase